jgi:hypothetical protein
MQDKFIKIYNNVLPNSFCDRVIAEFNKAHNAGFTHTRQQSEGEETLTTTKEDSHLFAPADLPFENMVLDSMSHDLFKEFNVEYLWGVAYKKYAEEFGILNQLPPHYSYVAKVQKTKPGQGYHIWHCEHAHRDNGARIATWTAYLNDDFEAGETEFLYQQYRYKPKKGDMVIFPASYTHVHRGNPPIGGDKYIITGWFQY